MACRTKKEHNIFILTDEHKYIIDDRPEEKEVKPFGTSGHIIVPKKLIGKQVVIGILKT